MELLIPGLILVALMAWASTKIKKRAADAFEAEDIEMANYFVRKPEGFLHVLGGSSLEFYAYSKEFGEGENNKFRRATIAIDVILHDSFDNVKAEIERNASKLQIRETGLVEVEIDAEEVANGITINAFYKLGVKQGDTYRLRFAVLPEYTDDYLPRIEDTIESFTIRPLLDL